MKEAKSFPFPVLSPASLDYREGVKYDANILRMGDSDVVASHHVHGGSIVSQLLQSGRAAFACVVSLPATMYRRVFVCDSSSLRGDLRADHKIDYRASGAHDSVAQPKFRSVILAKEDCKIALGEDSGLDSNIWPVGGEINFPRGSIVAFDDWKEFKGGSDSMLQFKPDDAVGVGMMRVYPDTEGGFRFGVHVHSSFLSDLQEQPGDRKHHVTSILTHALSRGLEILAKGYQGDWQEYSNLIALADVLRREELPHWGDDDFRPEEVATYLYPHTFAEGGDDE